MQENHQQFIPGAHGQRMEQMQGREEALKILNKFNLGRAPSNSTLTFTYFHEIDAPQPKNMEKMSQLATLDEWEHLKCKEHNEKTCEQQGRLLDPPAIWVTDGCEHLQCEEYLEETCDQQRCLLDTPAMYDTTYSCLI
ncbi:hypothetical protein MAR_031588 [Mya arenaria]|uniref:Uncharacterized protein n=1 Tax=Mya arenaria TaxID=6604 RepID=A0ABY7F6J8_MYAAR|nr:hypothetical protein MAR_031588 [Mya arenaria]